MNRTTALVRTLYCCMCVYVVVLQAGSGSPTRKSEFGLAISAWTTGRIARPVRRRRQTSPCSQQTTGVIAHGSRRLDPTISSGRDARQHAAPLRNIANTPNRIFILSIHSSSRLTRTHHHANGSADGLRMAAVRRFQHRREQLPAEYRTGCRPPHPIRRHTDTSFTSAVAIDRHPADSLDIDAWCHAFPWTTGLPRDAAWPSNTIASTAANTEPSAENSAWRDTITSSTSVQRITTAAGLTITTAGLFITTARVVNTTAQLIITAAQLIIASAAWLTIATAARHNVAAVAAARRGNTTALLIDRPP